MNHGKKLATVVAYDIYLECCQGGVTLDWKVDKPVSFHRFREKLAIQQLQYSPANLAYPGDQRSRAATQLPLKRRRNTAGTPRSPRASSGSSAASSILENETKRLCGDLGQLHEHIASVEKLPKSGRVCAFCGDKCYEVFVAVTLLFTTTPVLKE